MDLYQKLAGLAWVARRVTVIQPVKMLYYASPAHVTNDGLMCSLLQLYFVHTGWEEWFDEVNHMLVSLADQPQSPQTEADFAGSFL